MYRQGTNRTPRAGARFSAREGPQAPGSRRQHGEAPVCSLAGAARIGPNGSWGASGLPREPNGQSGLGSWRRPRLAGSGEESRLGARWARGERREAAALRREGAEWGPRWSGEEAATGAQGPKEWAGAADIWRTAWAGLWRALPERPESSEAWGDISLGSAMPGYSVTSVVVPVCDRFGTGNTLAL